MTTIRIQPAARLRQQFATWATAQHPKIRTVAPNTFAVSADLFQDAPEDILIGALVDGQRYVSPAEDAQKGTPPPGSWTPPVLPEQEAVPGEPLPPVPDSAYGPDSVPLDPPEFAPGGWVPVPEGAPAADEDSDRSDSTDDTDQAAENGFHCGVCDRLFPTERGRDTHRRMAHNEVS